MSDEKLEALQAQIAQLDNRMHGIIDVLDNINTIINNNFIVLDERLKLVGEKLDILHADTHDGFHDVKYELVKIQKITGYQDHYDNMKVVSGKE